MLFFSKTEAWEQKLTAASTVQSTLWDLRMHTQCGDQSQPNSLWITPAFTISIPPKCFSTLGYNSCLLDNIQTQNHILRKVWKPVLTLEKPLLLIPHQHINTIFHEREHAPRLFNFLLAMCCDHLSVFRSELIFIAVALQSKGHQAFSAQGQRVNIRQIIVIIRRLLGLHPVFLYFFFFC